MRFSTCVVLGSPYVPSRVRLFCLFSWIILLVRSDYGVGADVYPPSSMKILIVGVVLLLFPLRS